ncbi:sce7726 family protein [Methylophaga sp.]|uniref:sce7726 family protein n=1 Tax=Methylophaga sp. TaxID=2024840 RepID=UPI003A8F26DB
MREAEIKQALTLYLGENSPEHSPLFLEELRMNGGEVRADLVRIGDMHCFEIKSEADSLARLVSQGSRYSRAFDRVTLVTAKKHLEKALPMLPTWWGIIVIPENTGKPFKHIRKAQPNKGHEASVLASLLNRDEALNVLTESGITKGVKSKSLYTIQAMIAETLPLDQLKKSVQDSLISRASCLMN